MKILSLIKFLVLAIFLHASSNTYPKRKILVEIPQLKNTFVFLGRYYGERIIIVDTIRLNSKGKAKYKNNLCGGVYVIATSSKRNFMEFVLNEPVVDIFIGDTNDMMGTASTKKSKENKALFDYLIQITKWAKKLEENNKLLKDTALLPNLDTATLKKENEEYIKKINEFKEKFVKENSHLFATKVILIGKDPEIPNDISNDTLKAYYFFRTHYLDNIDFSDERYLYTPTFWSRIQNYLDKIIPQEPDTVAKEVINIIEKSKGCREIFKFLIGNLAYKYETSPIMGMENVFVEIVNKYFATGKVDWIDTSKTQEIVNKARELEPTLVGKIAPRLILADSSQKWYDLYALKSKYIVLFFFDPDCGHCKKAAPSIVEFYQQYKNDNITVWGISLDTSWEKTKQFIKDYKIDFLVLSDHPNARTNFRKEYAIYSTPFILVLDEDKKIIGRRLPPEALSQLLKHHSKKTNQKQN